MAFAISSPPVASHPTPSRNGGQGGGGSGPEEEGQEGQAGGQEVNEHYALTPLPRPSFLHRSLLGGVY